MTAPETTFPPPAVLARFNAAAAKDTALVELADLKRALEAGEEVQRHLRKLLHVVAVSAPRLRGATDEELRGVLGCGQTTLNEAKRASRTPDWQAQASLLTEDILAGQRKVTRIVEEVRSRTSPF